MCTYDVFSTVWGPKGNRIIKIIKCDFIPLRTYDLVEAGSAQ